MGVRFVIGRAGCGKTHHCLDAIRRRLRQDPLDGPRLILLVPEQASFQMERAIVEPADRAKPEEAVLVSHRAEVLSFRRLAYRVLESTGDPSRSTLSETARAMVLRHIAAERCEQLRYYHRSARPARGVGRQSGFIERLSATVQELIEEAITPDDLAALAESCSGSDGDSSIESVGNRDPLTSHSEGKRRGDPGNPAQAAKFHDLHLIYSAYLDYLGTDKLDPTQTLQLARASLPRCAWLTGAEVWIDGFASFSGQESLTVVALAKQAGHVDLTMMVDPSLVATTSSAAESSQATARLFDRPLQTLRDLRKRFRKAGVEVAEPLLLEPAIPERFRASEALAGVERWLFLPAGRSAAGVAPSAQGVEIVELPSRRIEVDYAVSRVCRWVQDPDTDYRYRDIAIIARDLDPYHDLLSEALTAHDIPFFIDRRRPITHHPLIELLRAGPAVAADCLSLGAVRLLLKTGLLPVDEDEADELENYLLAHGLGGADAWRVDAWTFTPRSSFLNPEDEPTTDQSRALERINATRVRLLAHLDEWLAAASSGRAMRGTGWTAALLAWFDRLGVADTLRRWADLAEDDGDLDAAKEHRQVWRDVRAFLDDLAFAFGEIPLSVADLADIVEAGLSRLTLGLVPPMVDQVLVGSIERSRHPAIRAAVILGLNDGVFPKLPGEDAILNDDDRARFQEAGLPVQPGTRESVFEESTLCYVAFTRASESLVVTYATADDDGGTLRPSPYVEALRAACPGLAVDRIANPVQTRGTWNVWGLGDLTVRLAMEFRNRPGPDRDDGSIRGRWNELYDRVRADLKRDPASAHVLTGLDEKDDDSLCPESIERLYAGTLRTSVSRLESFATCPFQHFARYALRLRERAEAKLEAVDVGQVHHAILEAFVGSIAKGDQGLAHLDDAALLAALDESCRRVAASLPEDGTLSDARNAYVLRRSAAELMRIVQAQRRQSQSGRARPRAAELPFGFDAPGGLPGLELSTPAGRRVLLRGYIDRVDVVELADELLGIVIDYKQTRNKRFDFSSAYHGLSLQLVAYLLALAEGSRTPAGRPIRPIGALYVSLASQYRAVDHPSRVSPRDLALGGTYRPRGVLLADRFDALDAAGEAGWSQHYNVFRTKDGVLGHVDSNDAVAGDWFQAMLDHTRNKLGELADGVLDGDVSARPYRLGTFSPCGWCTMASVCRFDRQLGEVRFLESLKRSEVFRKITNRAR